MKNFPSITLILLFFCYTIVIYLKIGSLVGIAIFLTPFICVVRKVTAITHNVHSGHRSCNITLTQEAIDLFEEVHDNWELEVCKKYPHDVLIVGT